MKIFSLEEAQAMLPVLEALLRRAIEAKEQAESLENEMQALTQSIFFSGGMLIDTVRVAEKRETVRTALQRAQDAVQEIESTGVQVKDLNLGLLDFPCQTDTEIVLLCWKLGETEITHWHTVDSGFQGRQPIDDRFLRHREKPN